LLVFPVDGLAANSSELKVTPASGAASTGVPGAAVATQAPSAIPPPPITPKLDCLIEPNMMVDLATSVSGIVKVVNVDRGDIVKTGQILAQLEAEVEKANVAHSRARVEFSTKKFHRMQELYKEQMVSAQQMEEAKTENDLAVAELRKATEMLHQRSVYSPFNGVVVERYVSPGELVEGKKVIKVAQINPLRVEVIAPIAMLGEFKMGAKMQVAPEGPVAGPFEARVHLVDRVIDAPSGTFRVRLALTNPRYQISAGVRCKAQLIKPIPEKPKGMRPKAKATKIKGGVVKRPDAPKADTPVADVHKGGAPSAATPKADSQKVDTQKVDASPGDAAKGEARSTETQNVDVSKGAISTENAPKGEESKADAKKLEPPKNSVPGAETPQADPLKTEAPKGEVQQREEPKADHLTEKTSKNVDPKVDGPNAEPPTSETPGVDIPKASPLKTESQNSEAQPRTEGRENIPAGYDADS